MQQLMILNKTVFIFSTGSAVLFLSTDLFALLSQERFTTVMFGALVGLWEWQFYVQTVCLANGVTATSVVGVN